jgi:sialidase-1
MKGKQTLLWIVFVLCLTSYAQNTMAGLSRFDGISSRWKGFEKVSFLVGGRDAYVIFPKELATGNPWVWRARFPTWHADMDLMLLEQGVSIAYIDVKNLYGSPTAISHWDAFYAMMVSKEMSKKPALEGVSRGGLICYNWAKKNPEKVACLYLEAPVCDIKSWPGGKGAGQEDSDNWKRAQKAYGLDEAGMMAWADNPLDDLDALAEAKVPIYTSIGLNDNIVPPVENTLKLMQRYIELGGSFTVHPMTRSLQKLEGHHFLIEDPERIFNFIQFHLGLEK